MTTSIAYCRGPKFFGTTLVSFAVASALIPGGITRNLDSPHDHWSLITGPPRMTNDQGRRTRSESSFSPRLKDVPGRLPLSFEANQGQADNQTNFLSRGTGYRLNLTASEAVLALRNTELGSRNENENSQPTIRNPQSTELRMKLIDAHPESHPVGLDRLPGRVNYLIGNDPTRWRKEIPTYARVKYESIYPGVDVIYYGNQGQLEYDFIVAPGFDPNSIRLGFEGQERLEVSAQGDLMLQTTSGSVRMHKPVVYQEISGQRIAVEGAFKSLNPHSAIRDPQSVVGFEIGEYDATKPLVIDPTLSYSTYLGGSENDIGLGIAVDADGNVYVTGETLSGNFPIASALQTVFGGGAFDVFVAKLNPAGVLLYSTYLGGSGTDIGRSIAVDSAGNAYITGNTNSVNFPTTAGVIQGTFGGGTCGTAPNTAPCSDVFVAKLDPTGSTLFYSTYLGGGGADQGNGITIDAAGNVYVVGQTGSMNFPTSNAFQTKFGGGTNDAFVAKLNAAGSMLVYSSYAGGSGNNDIGRNIAVDMAGNAYFTGLTSSTNFPVTANALQSTYGNVPANNVGHGFVSKVDPAGKLIYSTFLGGSMIDDGFAIAVDSGGNIYLTGDTSSPDFPTKNPVQAIFGGGTFDNFVLKINAAGSALIYSTYLGGSGTDQPKGIALDASGNVYVTGNTNSPNFPTANAVQATFGGGTCGTAPNTAPCNDAFVTKVNAAGSAWVYSTYLGGSAADQGNGIKVDALGNVYVIGQTGSMNFPTAKALQPSFGGGTNDVFVTKIAP